ncbi:MAG: hypothetical protein FWB96_13330 [Defluviitaleaceae bacterium]|nr:hypothetical protein [Defluviitaleaceae bacterium]MCL2264269.1 hypothetical protein [Defluviitaleaceae bacterium]
MDDYTVYTNNSVVAEYFAEKELPIEVKWVAAPAMEVLSAAKSAAHLGAVILSNPMSGVRTSQPLFGPASFERPNSRASSAPPKIRSINPYLSVLAGPSRGTVDFVSVKNIDEALTLYKKNARLRFVGHNDDTIKAFQSLDLETLLATITAIESLGH